jgi:hypothetical protein
MSDVKIFRNSTDKPLDTFVADLSKTVEKRGFALYHQDKADLTAFYRNNGVELPANYKHVILQVCKPQQSGGSLLLNPERSVFVQKFIFAYSKGEKTEVRFLGFSGKLIADLLGHSCFENGPSDDAFGERMEGTFAAMQEMVAEAL